MCASDCRRVSGGSVLIHIQHVKAALSVDLTVEREDWLVGAWAVAPREGRGGQAEVLVAALLAARERADSGAVESG